MDLVSFLGQNFQRFWEYTGFANATPEHFVMLAVGLLFIWLAIKKNFEPLLLVPIGFGILVGNIPFKLDAGLEVGIYEQGSVLNILYDGVSAGWYPPLIFLGIGAMTDFSALIANPKLMLIGAAAQFGIFGFAPDQSGAIAIIGGADGPTAIFLSSKLAPNLMGAIAVSAYSYMALVPLIQPPIMRLLTTKKERVIKMKPARAVSQNEKIMFPIVGLLLTCFVVPSALPLLGMLFFGNLLRESGVTTRLAKTASNALNDIIVMLLGLTVGASTQASEFLTFDTLKIFFLGAMAFIIANVWCALRQGVQPVPAERQENQSAHRQRRRFCRSDVGTYLKQHRFGIRLKQLSAHARHGSERCRSDWFCRSCRCIARLPRIIDFTNLKISTRVLDSRPALFFLHT